jgi:hypothetical protein
LGDSDEVGTLLELFDVLCDGVEQEDEWVSRSCRRKGMLDLFECTMKERYVTVIIMYMQEDY